MESVLLVVTTVGTLSFLREIKPEKIKLVYKYDSVKIIVIIRFV